MIHPSKALLDDSYAPLLPVCEHIAGNENYALKTIDLAERLPGAVDITLDCEDGAPLGDELAHARRLAQIAHDYQGSVRLGVRLHDIRHPIFEAELEVFLSQVGERLAYVTLPKVHSLQDVQTAAGLLASKSLQAGLGAPPPLHVLIETLGALHQVFAIAAHPSVQCLAFGLMDFVSSHHGAISKDAMTSLGQFTHPLVVRAKAEIAAASHTFAKVCAHSVIRELSDMKALRAATKKARAFGFTRQWSIHPNQIAPIIEVMTPSTAEVKESSAILLAAANQDWGPIRFDDILHDRASYRYHWHVLRQAQQMGKPIPLEATQAFFFQNSVSPS